MGNLVSSTLSLDEVESLRRKAREHGENRAELSKQSQDAWKSGDKSKAKDFSNQSKLEHQKQLQLDQKAASKVFEINNKNQPADTIDLHGLYAKEARTRCLSRIDQDRKKNRKYLIIVVGRGNHSQDGIRKLEPEIQKILKELNFPIKVTNNKPNAGCIYVEYSEAGNRSLLKDFNQTPRLLSELENMNSLDDKVNHKEDMFNSVEYKIQFSNSPIRESNIDRNLAQSKIIHKEGISYFCVIDEPVLEPSPFVDDKGTSNANLPTTRAFSALLSLKGQCFTKTIGWWTYEFCPMKHVRQFHSSSKNSQDDDIFLGVFNPETQMNVSKEEKKPKFISESYFYGDDCDITDQPRQVRVQYFCSPDDKEEITDVHEYETCKYHLTFNTPKLCKEPKFRKTKRPTSSIVCREIVANGKVFVNQNHILDEKAQFEKLLLQMKLEEERTSRTSWDSFINHLKRNTFHPMNVFLIDGENQSSDDFLKEVYALLSQMQGVSESDEDLQHSIDLIRKWYEEEEEGQRKKEQAE